MLRNSPIERFNDRISPTWSLWFSGSFTGLNRKGQSVTSLVRKHRMTFRIVSRGWILVLAICYLAVSVGFDRSWCETGLTEPEVACCCRGVCACGDSCPGGHGSEAKSKARPTDPVLIACDFDGEGQAPNWHPNLPLHLPVKAQSFIFIAWVTHCLEACATLRERHLEPPDKVPILS